MEKTGRDKFSRNSRVLDSLARIFSILPKVMVIFIWDCISNKSQLFFIGLRYAILKSLIKQCGDNVKVGTNVQIFGWEKLSIGKNVSIHANCYLDANGEIQIKDNVSIAHNSTILSSNHGWDDENLPIKYNPVTFSSVIVEEDVWIGCGCRILAGVVIGKRAIVAAGAVVNRDVVTKTIVGGVPARLIKSI